MLVVDGNRKKIQLLLLGAVALSTLSACAESGIPMSAPMRLGSAAFAPRGYLQFCERRPDQCGIATPIAEADRASLERTLMQEQWANILNLQPTAISAEAAPPTALPPPPVPTESPAPLDLTGSLDLGDKLAPHPSLDMVVVGTAAPATETSAATQSSTALRVATLAEPADASSVMSAFNHPGLEPNVDPAALSSFVTGVEARPTLSNLLAADTAPAPVSSGLNTLTVRAASSFALASDAIAPLAWAPAAPPADRPVAEAVQPSLLHLTPLVWEALNGVNQSVNAKIRPMDDERAFGVADYWTLPLSDGPRAVGNCKHYVLEKRKALVDAGFSPNVLSIAIVKTSWGEVHSVLIVGTDQGDYVLDNLTSAIKAWKDVRYSWIERQTPGKPLRWAGVLLDDQSTAS